MGPKVENLEAARMAFSRPARCTTRTQDIVALLKCSQFVVGSAKAVRGLIRDVRVLAWVSGRRRAITDYLNSHPVKKLQIGASNNLLPGWLNTDLCRNHASVLYLDATRRFPFDSNTFDYIMSEHMIEHVPYQAAQAMLRECYRVLRPGGRVRFATPDLRVLLALHSTEKTDKQKLYVAWALERFLPDVAECSDVFVINNFFHSWGHCFLYDQETLEYTLRSVGFRGMKFYKPGASEDPNLKDLECHGKELQSEDINQFETMVVEGYKAKLN
jgi:predicted SAM-dependent methyltransferase